MFDTAHRNLYVALTGDSRAVAGVWEQTPDGAGFWRVDVLTEDQTGRNPSELRRSVQVTCLGSHSLIKGAECKQSILQTR